MKKLDTLQNKQDVEIQKEKGLIGDVPIRKRNKPMRLCRDIILNIINLINTQQVKIKTFDPDREKNEKRARNGKVLIPERKIIKLNGELTKYINSIEAR